MLPTPSRVGIQLNCTDCVIVLSTRRIPQIGIDINKSIIGDNPNYGNMSIFRGY